MKTITNGPLLRRIGKTLNAMQTAHAQIQKTGQVDAETLKNLEEQAARLAGRCHVLRNAQRINQSLAELKQGSEHDADGIEIPMPSPALIP